MPRVKSKHQYALDEKKNDRGKDASEQTNNCALTMFTFLSHFKAIINLVKYV